MSGLAPGDGIWSDEADWMALEPLAMRYNAGAIVLAIASPDAGGLPVPAGEVPYGPASASRRTAAWIRDPR